MAFRTHISADNDDLGADSTRKRADEETRKRLRRLAHLLDNAIPLPGGYRVGFDGAIGLIPGIGDLAGAALSSYVIAEAHRIGVPSVVLLRMLLNVLVETAVGAIPVAGDLFDFVWKANLRNVVLLEEHLGQPREVRRQSRWILAGVILGVVSVSAGALLLFVWILKTLLQ
jgi:hypothetical protein